MKNMIKNTVVSLAAVAALSSAANADVMSVFMPDNSVSGVYAGLGFGQTDINYADNVGRVTGYDYTIWTPMIQVGWQYNKYLAFEGRYQWGKVQVSQHGNVAISDLADLKFRNMAAYLKPQYTFKGFTGYGLVGYGDLKFEAKSNNSDSSFQYGLGGAYALSSNTNIFVDYTWVYDDTGFANVFRPDTNSENMKVTVLNFGVNYKF